MTDPTRNYFSEDRVLVTAGDLLSDHNDEPMWDDAVVAFVARLLGREDYMAVAELIIQHNARRPGFDEDRHITERNTMTTVDHVITYLHERIIECETQLDAATTDHEAEVQEAMRDCYMDVRRRLYDTLPVPTPEQRYPTDAAIDLITTTYIDRVRANDSDTWPAVRDVIDAIDHDGGPEGYATRDEVVMEMIEAAPAEAYPLDLSDTEVDTWHDAIEATLPTVAERLRAGRRA